MPNPLFITVYQVERFETPDEYVAFLDYNDAETWMAEVFSEIELEKRPAIVKTQMSISAYLALEIDDYYKLRTGRK